MVIINLLFMVKRYFRPLSKNGVQQPDFSYLEYKEERILARRKKGPRPKSGSRFGFTIDAMLFGYGQNQ
jgi:hypothetical protein